MAHFLQKLKWKFDFFPVWVKLVTAYLQCLLNVSRVLLRNFKLLLARSIANLWWMPMYILQVSSQVKRCSLDLVRTTELRIFNELNVYKSAVAQLAVCLFFLVKRKKTGKTLYIIALKLFKKPLSSSLYKLQINFIKRYTLTMHSMCLGIKRTKNIQIHYSSICHC